MLLTLAQTEKLKKKLDGYSKQASLELALQNRNKCLKEFESTVIKLNNKLLLDSGAINHLLQLGTAIRRGSLQLALIAASVFLTLKSLIEQTENPSEYRFVIFEGVSRALEYDEFSSLGTSLVWIDEREAIIEFLSKDYAIDLEKIYRFKKVFETRFEILRRGGLISIIFWEKIDYLSDLSGLGDETKSKLSRSALAYLVETEDVVDDRLGLFGLVDDIEAINHVYYKVRPELMGTHVFSEFLSVDNSIQSLLLERSSSSFPEQRPLTGLSTPIVMNTAAVNYLMQSGKNRILNILPDKGVIILPQLCSMLITQDKPNLPTSIDKLAIGTRLYFNLPKESIEVVYQGKSPDIAERVLIEDTASRKNSNVLMHFPNEAINFATLEPQRKKISPDAAKLQKWLIREWAFVPPHIAFSHRRFTKILILTSVSKFENQLREFSPFGINLGQYVDFKYQSSNGESRSLITPNTNSGSPVVDVFSSAEIAMEELEKMDGGFLETILLCDDEGLASNFLGLMSDGWGFQDLHIVLMSDSQHEQIQKIAKRRNFSTIALQNYFEELEEEDLLSHSSGSEDPIALTDKFDDTLSFYEKKIIRSSRKPEYDFMPVNNIILDEFLSLQREIWKEAFEGNPIEKSLLFKMQSFSETFLNRYGPLSSEEKLDFDKQYGELVGLAERDAANSSSVKKFLDLINNKPDSFTDISRDRGVLEFIRANPDKSLALFVEHDSQISRADKLMGEFRLRNCKVYSAASLVGRFLDTPLIIPYLPSNRNARILTSAASSTRLILFFCDFEKTMFIGRRKKAETHSRRLGVASASSFAGTRAANTMRKIADNLREEQTTIPPETDVFVSEFLQKHSGKYVYNGRNSTEAIPIYFEGNAKLIFIAPGSELFIFRDNDEFVLSNAKNLKEGDIFCLLIGSKADMLDEIALIREPHFSQIKSTASTWKKELRSMLEDKFSGDHKLLCKYLADNGIVRTEATIHNWTNDSSIIAPQQFDAVIKNISKLEGVSLTVRDGTNEICDSIRKCYQARRKAGSQLLEVINKAAPSREVDGKLSVKMGTKSLEFELCTMSTLGSQISVPHEDLWKIQEVS